MRPSSHEPPIRKNPRLLSRTSARAASSSPSLEVLGMAHAKRGFMSGMSQTEVARKRFWVTQACGSTK